jgi:hypothetical protein
VAKHAPGFFTKWVATTFAQIHLTPPFANALLATTGFATAGVEHREKKNKKKSEPPTMAVRGKRRKKKVEWVWPPLVFFMCAVVVVPLWLCRCGNGDLRQHKMRAMTPQGRLATPVHGHLVGM